MPTDSAPVLVTGATGKQGGATARALIAAGARVRALVRDPSTYRAKAVEALGAELITGDLHDRDSVIRAAEGARAVFSIQMPEFTDGGVDVDGEIAQAVNLIEGAKTAGVPQFVHTSVSGAGQHTGAPGWAEGRWAAMEPVLGAKAAIQNHVRAAEFPQWTILKPGTFMENFLPSAAYMFPRGIDGGLVSVIDPRTPLSLVAVDDIGRAATAAITAPQRFQNIELELASDYLSMTDIAEILTRTLGIHLTAPDMTEQQAAAAGMAFATAHEWLNVVGQPARPQYATDLGIPLTTFAEWARQHMRADA
ncbi:NmrA/HSCARG family protein [Nocardia sp. NPDC005978]|uniref:NmrA/HSCARG family protein n=1 Tax=Nocardia sp. NPDC005978 TaxID=3156725 RepID=UPI0033A9CA61